MSESAQTTRTSTDDQQVVDRARLELLDLLLEAAAEGFFDWRLDTDTVFYSARFRVILGYEDEAIPDKPWAWLELAHPEDRAMAAKALEDLIAGDWPFDLTFRMKHRVAGWRWFRGRAAAHRDQSGNATRVVATFGDVTAQVRAERRQTSLINAVPDLLIRVQNDSTVIDVKIPEGDGAYARATPQPREKLCDSPFASGWSGQAQQALAKALIERQPTRFEAQRRSDMDNADACDIEVRVFPSSDDESLFVIRDITTEKHQREQGLQSQKLEAIGQLAAGIAHEINTPLQFVGDNLHFLAEATDALRRALEQCRGMIPEAQISALKAMESDLDLDYMTEHLRPAFSGAIDGVERVSVIVQAMKAFAHPGTKEKRPEDLNHAIETTLILSTNVWKYVANVERDLAPDLPKVDCVIGEINQVLLNLITNAAYAIGEVVGESGAQGRIHVATRCDADWVEIRIADSGHGIPAAVRPRIFEPFFTTKPVGKGTGQGLPLARAIVLQHEGRLEFQTEEGRGTTFIVRLPVVQTTASTRKSLTSP
jgi:two-component system, NtrC family, sensor kinase